MTRRWKFKDAKLKERLWWLDVVYPMALAIILFGSLTYVVYSGQRQSRLAPQAERKLLEFSLRGAGDRPAKDTGGVLVVNAEPADIMRLGRAPGGPVPDASAAAYAQVLTKLADAGVPVAIVFWDIEAHLTDEVYCLPLIEALHRIGSRMKVLLAMPAEGYDRLPPALKALAGNAVLDLCADVDTVNIECAYRADYQDFVLQMILKELGDPPGEAPETRRWVSTQLSSQLPSYILSLSPPQALATTTFSRLLGTGAAPAAGHFKMAVVGPNEADAVSSAGGSTYSRYTRTVFDPPGTNAEVGGTPMHVFWGEVAQMYIDKAMVNMPPFWVSILATVLLCLLIGAAMRYMGGPASLGMFLLYVASGPYVNALGIKYFQVYLPLFDGYYFGMTTFVAAGLGRLSVTAFQRWRLDAQRRTHAHAKDLKGNFVSLLSHNLNTPVAKMQGMLGLLSAKEAAAPWSAELRAAEAEVTQLEHAIRGVLVTSALEEGSLSETPRAVKALASEVGAGFGSSLKRLGLIVTMAPPEATDPEDAFLPLSFDLRALGTVVGAMAALFRRPGELVPLTIGFRVESQGGDKPELAISFSSTGAWIPAAAAGRLGGATDPTSAGETSFFAEVASGLALQAVRRYRGRIEVRPAQSGPGGSVTLWLAATGGTVFA